MIEAPNVSDGSLVYMYGISDFWTNVFGDSELVEGILASETISLAEVYSNFLQRSAGISLDDIQKRYHTRIKLLLLSDSDSVDPLDLTEFNLVDGTWSAERLMNRALLPTQTLNNGRDYEINTTNSTIKFNKPISEYKFPVRYTETGTPQYAIWMSDVEVDDKWINNSFGRLVEFDEEDSVFNYKQFLQGVYYLYANGPNKSNIERGVNLTMGMPYARATEEVLSITQDLTNRNHLVFTASQSYLLPYGTYPDLAVGDTLQEGQLLSSWIEVQDYYDNGEWWYNVYLPNEVLNGYSSRDVGRCSPGSVGDRMMQDFLKHHMFQVIITPQPDQTVKAFTTAQRLVNYAKPSYTFPIFVWKAILEDEPVNLVDDFKYEAQSYLDDTCIAPPSVRYMDRGASYEDPTDPKYRPYFLRGKHWYNRFQGSEYTATLLGYGDWPGNSGWTPEFQTIGDKYGAYTGLLMGSRGDTNKPTSRGVISRGYRSYNTQGFDGDGNPRPDIQSGITRTVVAADTFPLGDTVTFNDRNVVPLYLMTANEVVTKIRYVNPSFNINGRAQYFLRSVDMFEHYDNIVTRTQNILEELSGDFNFPYANVGLNPKWSPYAYQMYAPSVADIESDGKLFFQRVDDDTWTVGWLVDATKQVPTMFPVEDADDLRAVYEYPVGVGADVKITRGMVEENQARFLLDRSRADGIYDDYLEDDELGRGANPVMYMNRGGVPTTDTGVAERINVIRRLQ